MKKNYFDPIIDIIVFSQEEILTDIIVSSQTSTAFEGIGWNDFVNKV